MKRSHAALFDRLGKALEREIAKCEIDLNPPRAMPQRDPLTGSGGGWVSGSLTPIVPVSPAPLGKPVIFSDGGTMHLSDTPGSFWTSTPFQPPPIPTTVVEASPEDVKKYGVPSASLGSAQKPANMPLLAWLKALEKQNHDDKERAKKKGKG